MIRKRIKELCKDYQNIENYDKAIDDTTQTWECHHRLETHFSDGSQKPVSGYLSYKELIALGMYWNRPAEEFMFLTRAEHNSLHKTNNNGLKGHKHSEETKNKISQNSAHYCAIKGKHWKLVDGKRVYF